jgi:NitT/TauT family transport system substrate-binding protein
MYIAMTSEKKLSAEDLATILRDPQVRIGITPANTMIFANYRHDVGTIAHLPASWKDYFWPVAHALAGS